MMVPYIQHILALLLAGFFIGELASSKVVISGRDCRALPAVCAVFILVAALLVAPQPSTVVVMSVIAVMLTAAAYVITRRQQPPQGGGWHLIYETRHGSESEGGGV